MQITIINDCTDANAKGRQLVRVSALFGNTPVFIPVKDSIEAAGNIIDVLDAIGDAQGILLVNVAPRDGVAKKWKNGTPFAYFRYSNTLIVSSVGGYALSLLKKLSLIQSVEVLDQEKVFDELGIGDMKNTQFRSLELTPKIAKALLADQKLTTQTLSVDEIPDMPNCIWWRDNFGNLKTSIFEHEIQDTKIKDFKKFNTLKDVPDKEIAIIKGSSGFKDMRFVEIVLQGGSAGDHLSVDTGYLI